MCQVSHACDGSALGSVALIRTFWSFFGCIWGPGIWFAFFYCGGGAEGLSVLMCGCVFWVAFSSSLFVWG